MAGGYSDYSREWDRSFSKLNHAEEDYEEYVEYSDREDDLESHGIYPLEDENGPIGPARSLVEQAPLQDVSADADVPTEEH